MLRLKYLAILVGLLLLASGCAPVTNGESTKVPAAPAKPTSTLWPTEAPLTAAPTDAAVDYCADCHMDQDKLVGAASPSATPAAAPSARILGAGKAMQPWEKVLVDSKDFPNTVHGNIACIACHGGVQSADKSAAHVGLVHNPSENAQATCGKCHPDVVAGLPTSLHNTLAGFKHALDNRSSGSHPTLDQAFTENCTACHATCGDCHISQPVAAGGGLISGHKFNRTPPMTQTCTVCHAATIGNEFLGKNKDLPADVHFAQGKMECISCHNGGQMHGQPADCQACHKGPADAKLAPKDHIYGGVQAPRCESCHTKVTTGQDDVIMHKQHGAELSCQVCHAVAYNSCDACHVQLDSKTHQSSASIDGMNLGFLIGRNPSPSFERPYLYVPVQHSPVSVDTFKAYGENLLPNFNSVGTWSYTTPHNIQLHTPQTESCAACHNNPAMFLTADKVANSELEANKSVIVDQVPGPIGSGKYQPR